MSGLRSEIARRSGSSQLRDVSCVRSCGAASPAASSGGHHGGTSCSSATSHSQPSSDGRELVQQRATGGRHRAAVEEVPGEDPHAGPTLPPALPRRHRALARPAHLAAGPRARAQERARRPRARSRAARWRCCSRSRRPARASRSRRGSSSSAATRWCCAPASCSSRAASRCATPRSCSRATSPRSASAPATRTSCAALAEHATVPVVNMLSPLHHPCQALADLMTLREAFGSIEGRVLTYVGDGNNVARSLALVGALAGVEVRVAAPDGFQLEAESGAKLFDDPAEAVDGADAVYTDVWVSMSDDESTAAQRREALAPYRLDEALLDRAGPQRDRPALPARAPGRGDHRGRALRRAPAHLGPGREPPPCAEGAARAARFELGGRGRAVAAMVQGRRKRARSTRWSSRASAIQEVLDDAVERGRMTRDDATRPVRRARPARHGRHRRRRAPRHRARAGVPDRALRGPDRGAGGRPARRAVARAAAPVRDHERRNANRKTVLAAVERKLP